MHGINAYPRTQLKQNLKNCELCVRIILYLHYQLVFLLYNKHEIVEACKFLKFLKKNIQFFFKAHIVSNLPNMILFLIFILC